MSQNESVSEIDVLQALRCCGGTTNGFDCANCPLVSRMNKGARCKVVLHKMILEAWGEDTGLESTVVHSVRANDRESATHMIATLIDANAAEIRVKQGQAGTMLISWLLSFERSKKQ